MTRHIIAAAASLLQLVSIFAYMLVVAMVGPRFTSAEAFFAVYQQSLLLSLVRVDLPLLILVGLYLGTMPFGVVPERKHVHNAYRNRLARHTSSYRHWGLGAFFEAKVAATWRPSCSIPTQHAMTCG